MEFWEAFAKYAPQYLPILAAIAVIIFTRNYVYKGMVPETMLKSQIEREEKIHQSQSEREKGLVESAKDIENRLEEIVRQLETLTKKTSEELRLNTDRMGSVERCMSDLITSYNDLNYNFEMHRKGVPPTEVYLKERKR